MMAASSAWDDIFPVKTLSSAVMQLNLGVFATEIKKRQATSKGTRRMHSGDRCTNLIASTVLPCRIAFSACCDAVSSWSMGSAISCAPSGFALASHEVVVPESSLAVVGLMLTYTITAMIAKLSSNHTFGKLSITIVIMDVTSATIFAATLVPG